jgi:hypothetical protein
MARIEPGRTRHCIGSGLAFGSGTEIREVLMQTAIYCGIPAAVDAFRSASEVFNEIDKK